jgi:NADH dehydrogenase
VVAGAGYAGLHVALRLTARLRHRPQIELTLVDRHDYHQAVTELPRVAAGTRAAEAVRIPLQDVLATRVRFARTEIDGFDLDGRRLLTGAGPIGWGRLVLARAEHRLASSCDVRSHVVSEYVEGGWQMPET